MTDQPAILGQTQTGKNVLSGNAQTYSEDFSSQDHLDARDIHKKKYQQLEQQSRKAMLKPGGINHRQIMSLQSGMSHHYDQAEYHDDKADDITKAERKDKIPGGLADKKKPNDFDSKALAEGVKIEMEHTSSKDIATEIAMDHLTEDPNYYKKLKTIEKSLQMRYGLGYRLIKASGEGSRGGKVIGHTKSGKPIYDKQGERKPYPGEDTKTSAEKKEAENKPLKTIPLEMLPSDKYDSMFPNLKLYKKILKIMGDKAEGRYSWDHKTGNILVQNDEAKQILKQAILGMDSDTKEKVNGAFKDNTTKG